MNTEPKFKFFTPVKVRYQDTDQQGHVYFGTYYTFFDEGVEGYLEAIGYSYQQMLADNIDFIFAESHCTYKSSVKWPEVLNVHARIGYIGGRSLRYEFEIWAAADGRLVATGYIAVVTVDRDTFTPQPVPDALRRAVANYEGELPQANA